MKASPTVNSHPPVNRQFRTVLQRSLPKVGLYIILLASALLMVFPYIWMFSTSLKTEQEVYRLGIIHSFIPDTFRWQNYVEAWNEFPISRWLFNSLMVAALETGSTLVTSILAGYAFARLRFKGREILFYIYMGAMMVPMQVTLIPSFIIVKNLGLLNSYAGISVLHLVQFFGVFLMRQFFLNIPGELEDAARIDGCSWFRVLWQIVIPVSKPAIAALATLSVTASWNNFLWPLVVINKSDIMTVTVGLASIKTVSTPWGQLMAATAITMVPLTVLYIVFQRFFTQGIVMSGIKG
jgi:multiple sugar transport system permease protein